MHFDFFYPSDVSVLIVLSQFFFSSSLHFTMDESEDKGAAREHGSHKDWLYLASVQSCTACLIQKAPNCGACRTCGAENFGEPAKCYICNCFGFFRPCSQAGPANAVPALQSPRQYLCPPGPTHNSRCAHRLLNVLISRLVGCTISSIVSMSPLQICTSRLPMGS